MKTARFEATQILLDQHKFYDDAVKGEHHIVGMHPAVATLMRSLTTTALRALISMDDPELDGELTDVEIDLGAL
jgi:hypothetical protein